MENSSVIGRLSFLANVVGDGAVAGIQQMARGTGAAMTKLASSVPAAAFALSAASVAGIGAALIGGTIAAAQFEDSFALVRKVLARANEEELTAIRQSILDLSTEIPVAAGQLAQLGSIAGQLGVGVSDIPQFIDTVAKLGVATNMSAEQAAFSIARLANVTGIGAENADQLANVLVRLGNNTAATESEIVLLATRFGAVGKIAGLTADQTLAFSASVRATGTEAQAGATALQKFFLALQQAASQGGSRLSAFAEAVGMSGEEFRKLAEQDISNAAALFVEGLDKIGASGGDVQSILNDVGLGSVRVSKVMLSLSSDTEELRSNLDLANDEMERQSALNNEAEKRFGTLLNQMARFRNVIKAVMIDIGEGMVPVLAKFIGNIADAIAGFREFHDVLNTEVFLKAAKNISILMAILGVSKIAAVKVAFTTLTAALTSFSSASFIAANATTMLFAAFKPFLIGGAILIGVVAIAKVFARMAENVAGAKRNLDDFKRVMEEISLASDDVDISDTLTEGLFENLEEETQEAFKRAFGHKTTDVLKEILGNQSTEVLDNVQGLVTGLSSIISQSSSYLVTDEAATMMLENQLKSSKANLSVVEDTFGKESEIFKIGNQVVDVLEQRIEKGGKLNSSETKILDAALAQMDVYDDILFFQDAILNRNIESLKTLVKEVLVSSQYRGNINAILEDNELLLKIARQMAPENEKIATLIGFVKDDTEEVVENMNAFTNILQNANQFADELNKVLAPRKALNDLEDAKDSLIDARKEIVELNKEEEELNQELVSLEREMQELLEDGKFLSEDIISIKEEELKLAELIASANGEIELSAQEQLRLVKEERELAQLRRAAAQGSLTEGDLQIAAKLEEIEAIKTRGTTEEMVSDQKQVLIDAELTAQENANKRIIEIQSQQEDAIDRIIQIEGERADAARDVEDAQIDILEATNDTILAFAEFNNRGTEEMRELALALGMPEAVIDSIIGKIEKATSLIGNFEVFNPSISDEEARRDQFMKSNAVARASGGPVRIGQRGLVGENGPELIKPMPNGVMIKPLAGGQAGGVTQNVSLNITGLPTDPIAARKIAQNIQRELNKLKGDGRSGLVR